MIDDKRVEKLHETEIDDFFIKAVKDTFNEILNLKGIIDVLLGESFTEETHPWVIGKIVLTGTKEKTLLLQ